MTTTYLDLAGIAERAGIGHNSARTYHKRATANRAAGNVRPGDLPEPDITLGRIPGWAASTVEAWLADRPRAGADVRRRVPGRADDRPTTRQALEDLFDVAAVMAESSGGMSARETRIMERARAAIDTLP